MSSETLIPTHQTSDIVCHTPVMFTDAMARNSKSRFLLMSVYLDEYKVEAMMVRYLYGTDITIRNEVERAAISQ